MCYVFLCITLYKYFSIFIKTPVYDAISNYNHVEDTQVSLPIKINLKPNNAHSARYLFLK